MKGLRKMYTRTKGEARLFDFYSREFIATVPYELHREDPSDAGMLNLGHGYITVPDTYALCEGPVDFFYLELYGELVWISTASHSVKNERELHFRFVEI